MPTVGELKATLAQSKARWSVQGRLRDPDPLPTYRTGGLARGLPRADALRRLDFERLHEALPATNPFVLARRRARGFVPEPAAPERSRGSPPERGPGEGAPPVGGGTPVSLDWRDRFGWPWITTVRDQDGCEACWLFAAVALVEAMVRVEHCVWPSISEGDVHKGLGARCCDCGNPEKALDWMKEHGAADPGCFAWPVTTARCTACGGTGGDPYDNVAYTPTEDRSGRSVRIPAYTYVASVSDQKSWLDTVGPIVTFFEVWTDFFAYGAGVYHKQQMSGSSPNRSEGGHFMLIVGYDDAQQCWIVKNSWGTGWGQGGFCRIGYGECSIDEYSKVGLQGTNPDPWTKRRLHGGCMIESGNGVLHRNFEMLTSAPGGQIRHWWRDNSADGYPWHQGPAFGNDALKVCPTFTASTFHRNFEAVHLTNAHRLHHWWYDQGGHTWNDGGVFGPTDAAGVPGFMQANYNAPGNFEVVVRTRDSRLVHWWRDGAGWHDGGRFAAHVAHSGAALIQSHYGTRGNFELVCVLDTGQMQHWWRDNDHGETWNEGVKFGQVGAGSTIAGPPCMIEGQFGAGDERAVGNFELCVAGIDGKVQHWWRANGGDGQWHRSDTFGHDAWAVVALVESSFGYDLEVIVLRTDNKLQHYWRGGGGWCEGAVIGSVV